MKKKEIKKKAHPLLYSEKKSHQEVYEEFKTPKAAFNKIIASELSLLPSLAIVDKFKVMRYTYLILMVIVLGLRGLGAVAMFSSRASGTLKLFVFLIVIALPIYAIIMLMTHRVEKLRSVSFFFIFTAFRATSERGFGLTTEDLIWLVPLVGCISLGFILPNRMKTPYTVKTITSTVDGRKNVDFDIKFEEPKGSGSDEILDDL